MFIQHENMLINLGKVSNIKIKNTKIFFNMGYSIDMGERRISDYIDFTYSELDFKIFMSTLRLNEYIQDNFIEYYGGYINKNHISSVKSEPNRLKICINLSNDVSFRRDDQNTMKTTSEYIYINSQTTDEFIKEQNKFKKELL